jgi:hypothetical protein
LITALLADPVKVATVAVKAWPSTALMANPPSGTRTDGTLAVLVAVAETVSWTIFTVMVNVPDPE